MLVEARRRVFRSAGIAARARHKGLLVARSSVTGTSCGTAVSRTVASTQKTLLVYRHGTKPAGRYRTFYLAPLTTVVVINHKFKLSKTKSATPQLHAYLI